MLLKESKLGPLKTYSGTRFKTTFTPLASTVATRNKVLLIARFRYAPTLDARVCDTTDIIIFRR